ncbi:hypothetical protein QBC36DRAFT_316259 [Triangularia setosa]|uniref:Uncharacterized protein n=1 Tax=Triangularia setosa TaxID=2587417 RepID=A0AAN7A2H8_9PEZI|nr:hypothetical protein QBC36DRAFT_316259 [Podospora setosa]
MAAMCFLDLPVGIRLASRSLTPMRLRHVDQYNRRPVFRTRLYSAVLRVNKTEVICFWAPTAALFSRQIGSNAEFVWHIAIHFPCPRPASLEYFKTLQLMRAKASGLKMVNLIDKTAHLWLGNESFEHRVNEDADLFKVLEQHVLGSMTNLEKIDLLMNSNDILTHRAQNRDQTVSDPPPDSRQPTPAFLTPSLILTIFARQENCVSRL